MPCSAAICRRARARCWSRLGAGSVGADRPAPRLSGIPAKIGPRGRSGGTMMPVMAIPNSFDILQAVIDATPDCDLRQGSRGALCPRQRGIHPLHRQVARGHRRPERLRALSGGRRARLRRGRPDGARHRQAAGVRGRGHRTGRAAADLSGLEGRLSRHRRQDHRRVRHLARHHRAARGAREPGADPGGAVPLAEDGSGRPADRRPGARLQQHPRDHPRQHRAAPEVPAEGSVHRRDRRRRPPRHAARQGPDRSSARLLAAAPAQSASRSTSTSSSPASCGCSGGRSARRSA